jgi:hypothetical protein
MKKISFSCIVLLLLVNFAWASVPTGKIGIGAENITTSPLPSVRYYFNDKWGGIASLNYSSTNANNANTNIFTLGLRGLYNLSTFGNVLPQVGGEIMYVSNSLDTKFNNQSSSIFQIAGVFGAEIFILPTLSFSLTTYPLLYATGTGGGNPFSSFAVFSGATLGTHFYF